MTNISLDTRVRRKPQPHAAEVGGELVMMNVARGEYYGLDGVGTEIWQRLEPSIRVGDLVDALSQTYAGDPVVIAGDVCEFLTGLAARDLLEIAPSRE